jgi:CO/xanthine dehydrogenase Mo-binding subunit
LQAELDAEKATEYRLRIKANGYEPFESRVFQSDEGQIEYDVLFSIASSPVTCAWHEGSARIRISKAGPTACSWSRASGAMRSTLSVVAARDGRGSVRRPLFIFRGERGKRFSAELAKGIL